MGVHNENGFASCPYFHSQTRLQSLSRGYCERAQLRERFYDAPFAPHYSYFVWAQLTVEVKLTEFGAASPIPNSKSEDERGAAIALRAQRGDYNNGSQTIL